MKENLKRGREFIADNVPVPIPRELLLDMPKVIIVGNVEITVENHKGILTFDKDKVVINSNEGLINILGDSFEILFIGSDSLTLSGNFKSIDYKEKDNDWTRS